MAKTNKHKHNWVTDGREDMLGNSDDAEQYRLWYCHCGLEKIVRRKNKEDIRQHA